MRDVGHDSKKGAILYEPHRIGVHGAPSHYCQPRHGPNGAVPVTFIGWAIVAATLTVLGSQPATSLFPLAVLAGGFEAIHALHVGVERIGRYLQVFYESAPEGPMWETTAMSVGPALPGGGVDPLFTVIFAFATLAESASGDRPLPHYPGDVRDRCAARRLCREAGARARSRHTTTRRGPGELSRRENADAERQGLARERNGQQRDQLRPSPGVGGVEGFPGRMRVPTNSSAADGDRRNAEAHRQIRVGRTLVQPDRQCKGVQCGNRRFDDPANRVPFGPRAGSLPARRRR